MIQYPYLPEGRKILYVPVSNPFMKEAIETAKQFSSDRLQPTAAVVEKNGKVLVKMSNKVLLPPKLQELHRRGWCVRNFLKKAGIIKTGTKYWLCPGCSGFGSHAEARATTEAKKKGIDVRGSNLYLWGHWWCCKPCWNKMIESGIKNVYLLEGSEKLFNPKIPENILGRQFN